LIGDVVPFKNALGSVTSDFHNDGFGDTGPAQISHSSPSQIMEQQMRYAGAHAGLFPVWSGNWICLNLRYIYPCPVLAIMGIDDAESSRPIPVLADLRGRMDEPTAAARP
jgi:hypothetical protein